MARNSDPKGGPISKAGTKAPAAKPAPAKPAPAKPARAKPEAAKPAPNAAPGATNPVPAASPPASPAKGPAKSAGKAPLKAAAAGPAKGAAKATNPAAKAPAGNAAAGSAPAATAVPARAKPGAKAAANHPTEAAPPPKAAPVKAATASAPRPGSAGTPAPGDAGGRKPAFDGEVLASIRQSLLAQRGELERQLSAIEEAAFNSSQSEMSGEVSFDEDYADAGSFTFEREKDLSIANNVTDLRSKIDRALHNIEDGTYGICESCGKPIEAPRLKALPHVTLCLKCKKAEERR